MVLGNKIISLLSAVLLLRTPYASAQCPPTGFDAVKNFNITKYVGDRWYSLKEIPDFFVPERSLYCVFTDYQIITRKSPFCFLFGWLVGCRDPPAISIFEGARWGSTSGKERTSKSKGTIPDAENNPAKLNFGPYFLPNFLGRGTNCWVVAAGSYNELPGLSAEADSSIYQWAVITTGAPVNQGNNGLCRAK